MNDASDAKLLGQFARDGSQAAFAELVKRHIGLVYSVAFRKTGNAQLAEDVTQAVFIILARKAGSLGAKTVVPGWLYHAARLTASNVHRMEQRRIRRDQEAFMQSNIKEPAPAAEACWHELSPLLEDAIAGMGPTDRDAIVLRYFQNLSLAEVGSALGVTECAAQRRISRALEKLRGVFAKHGVHSTTAIIASAISSNSVQAAPPALAESVTAAAIAKGIAAGSSTVTLVKGALKIMAGIKAKTTATTAVVLLLLMGAGTATTITIHNVHARRVRSLEPIWRKNKDLPSNLIDALPPLFEVVPTKFRPPWDNWNSGQNGDKFAGARDLANILAGYAYDVPFQRIRFPDGLPPQRYDFVATLPHGSREAMQRWLKDNLGLVGHYETNDVPVLLLRIANTNAPGFGPDIPNRRDLYWAYDKGSGLDIYHSSDEIMYSLPRLDGFADFVEWEFDVPIIDQTGVTQAFAVPHLTWLPSGNGDKQTLRKALADQLGLELVPGHMPIEYLVMEKAK